MDISGRGGGGNNNTLSSVLPMDFIAQPILQCSYIPNTRYSAFQTNFLRKDSQLVLFIFKYCLNSCRQ